MIAEPRIDCRPKVTRKPAIQRCNAFCGFWDCNHYCFLGLNKPNRLSGQMVRRTNCHSISGSQAGECAAWRNRLITGISRRVFQLSQSSSKPCGGLARKNVIQLSEIFSHAWMKARWRQDTRPWRSLEEPGSWT